MPITIVNVNKKEILEEITAKVVLLSELKCPKCGEKQLRAYFDCDGNCDAVIKHGEGIHCPTIKPTDPTLSMHMIECEECAFETYDIDDILPEEANK